MPTWILTALLQTEHTLGKRIAGGRNTTDREIEELLKEIETRKNYFLKFRISAVL